MRCQNLLSEKKISLLCAEFAHRLLMVKMDISALVAFSKIVFFIDL